MKNTEKTSGVIKKSRVSFDNVLVPVKLVAKFYYWKIRLKFHPFSLSFFFFFNANYFIANKQSYNYRNSCNLADTAHNSIVTICCCTQLWCCIIFFCICQCPEVPHLITTGVALNICSFFSYKIGGVSLMKRTALWLQLCSWWQQAGKNSSDAAQD